MALQLKQSLSLTQQLIMTPQLQQAIKLLQLSRLELLDTIYTEMETNPMLEERPVEEPEEEKGPEPAEDREQDLPEVSVVEDTREKDLDWESYISEYNTGWAETAHEQREAPPFESLTSQKPDLDNHLMWQLRMGNFSDPQREIGAYIIGNVNDDGYLDVSLEEIASATGAPEEEVHGTLVMIQQFDPIGVAARDTQECLLIQARFQNLEGSLVEKILLDHMEKLENRRYDKMARALGVTIEEILSAVSIIKTLEPKPGRSYQNEETVYISPDIYVFKVGDEYQIVLMRMDYLN